MTTSPERLGSVSPKFSQQDGVHHLTREQQSRDNRRDEAFVNAGWSYFKANADDLAEGFEGVIARIKRAKLRSV